MEYLGNLQKMVVNVAKPLQYWLLLAENKICLNNYLQQKIVITHTGKIHCSGCQQSIKHSYRNGYCYGCSQTLARCDLCMVKPELCHYQLGTCREPSWGQEHCYAPHLVYVANSSQLKIGITRETQIPSRWIDQGAVQALAIIRSKTRYQAGLLEVMFAKVLADKTNWRKMLQGVVVQENLPKVRDQLFQDNIGQLQEIAGKFEFGEIELLTAEQVVNFTYPVLEYPKKIISLKLTKTPIISGILLGIKGQYLILDTGVFNVRNHAGYEIKFQ